MLTPASLVPWQKSCAAVKATPAAAASRKNLKFFFEIFVRKIQKSPGHGGILFLSRLFCLSLNSLITFGDDSIKGVINVNFTLFEKRLAIGHWLCSIDRPDSIKARTWTYKQLNTLYGLEIYIHQQLTQFCTVFIVFTRSHSTLPKINEEMNRVLWFQKDMLN